MSNVIQFLESMGKDATLGNMSPEEYTATVKALGVDDVAMHALLNRDKNALNGFLGGRLKMMMALVPAEDDDQGGGDQKDDDQKKEEEISIN
ncbi:MAG: hypothetical protein ACREO1_06125 [Arenimonas sp.]